MKNTCWVCVVGLFLSVVWVAYVSVQDVWGDRTLEGFPTGNLHCCSGVTAVSEPGVGNREYQDEKPSRDDYETAIQRVLEADSRFGAMRNEFCREHSLEATVQKYVSEMKSIDYSGCPPEFEQAFRAHIGAWEKSNSLFQRYPELRGEMHDLFDEIKSKGQPHKRLLEAAEKEIWGTWADVEKAGRVWTAPPDSGRRPAENLHPSISPGGKWIVFDSTRDGDWEIYKMKTDGSEQTRLTNVKGRDAHPFFSPDGNQIVFQSPRDGTDELDVDIYVMEDDGSNVRQLTDMSGFCGVPAWSPDGRRIVFQHSEDIDQEKWNLFIMNADGTGIKQLTDGTANDQVPNWFPDGSRLVFHSDRSGKNQLYSIRPDGSGLARLTHNDFSDESATWSPDGRRIAFRSIRNGDRQIFVMNSDGTAAAQLTTGKNGYGVPNWTPDGKRIVFQSDRNGGTQIFTMESDGSSPVQLTGSK